MLNCGAMVEQTDPVCISHVLDVLYLVTWLSSHTIFWKNSDIETVTSEQLQWRIICSRRSQRRRCSQLTHFQFHLQSVRLMRAEDSTNKCTIKSNEMSLYECMVRILVLRHDYNSTTMNHHKSMFNTIVVPIILFLFLLCVI